MHLTRLEAAVLLGIVIPQLSSITPPPGPSDCSAAVSRCMPDLCRNERAFDSSFCHDEGCQIKGSEVCNMTIQAVLDQFPSLRGCVCGWKEELCDSMQALAEQCRRKPASQQKRSTDWQSSSLTGFVYNGNGSCLDQITVCISDPVCNRHLVHVLQACTADTCDHDQCRQATRQLYGSMPLSVAEMLIMCECGASDQSCQDMKSVLQSGTCGDKTWICQDTVEQCVKDSNCRDLLKTFQDKCWHSEEVQCSDSDLQNVDCFARMDPALILGADSECKMAFLATLGTPLHYPCSCQGVGNSDLLTCNMIHDVLHNRSHFMTSWRRSSGKSANGPSKHPEINESEQGDTSVIDYLLYAFATVVLAGVVILMPLVVSKIWLSRRREEAKFHPVQKGTCVVIL